MKIKYCNSPALQSGGLVIVIAPFSQLFCKKEKKLICKWVFLNFVTEKITDTKTENSKEQSTSSKSFIAQK